MEKQNPSSKIDLNRLSSQPIKVVVVVVVPVTDDDVVIAVAVVVVDVVIIISHRTRYLPLKFGSVTADIFLLLLMLLLVVVVLLSWGCDNISLGN